MMPRLKLGGSIVKAYAHAKSLNLRPIRTQLKVESLLLGELIRAAMLERRTLHRAAKRTRWILKNVPFWCALSLIFFRQSFSTDGALFDYLQRQYFFDKADLQHLLDSMTELRAAWPMADAVLNFQRYAAAIAIGLSAKLFLALYAVAFVAALGVEHYSSDRSKITDGPTLPDPPSHRVRSAFASFVIIVFLVIVFFWIAGPEECLISGSVEMHCVGALPTLLAYCIVFAAIVELSLVPFKRSTRRFDKLLRVFE